MIRVVPLAAAALLLGLLGSAWAVRLPHPYDLEWMEGGMLAHAWRLQHGLPLYGPPSLDFVPFVYPPGYAAWLAALGTVVPLSPMLGRLVSLAGTLLAASSVAYIGARHGGSRTLGLAAGVAYLGTWQSGGAFFDLCRPDSVHVALLGWSVALALDGRRGTDVAAGLLLATAFVFKHSVAAFGVPMALGLFARGGVLPAVRFGLAAAVPALAFVATMQVRTDGRFLPYLLEVAASHPRYGYRAFPMTPNELGTALPLACAVPALWLLARFADRTPWPPLVTVYAPVLAGMVTGWSGTYRKLDPGILVIPAGFGQFALGVGAVLAVGRVAGVLLEAAGRPAPPPPSWREVFGGAFLLTAVALTMLMRAHNGGYLNVHLPLFLAVCVGWAITLQHVALAGWTKTAHLLAAAQLLYSAGTLDRRALVPTAADRDAGDRVVALIRDTDGEVFSPMASWLPVYAGRPPSAHHIAVWDLDYPDAPFAAELSAMRDELAHRRFAVVLDSGVHPFDFDTLRYYRLQERLQTDKDPALRPKTGWGSRPDTVLVPR